MRRRRWLAGALMLMGCSVPDDPNWRAIKESIVLMPIDARDAIERLERSKFVDRYFNREFYEYATRDKALDPQGHDPQVQEKLRDFEDQQFIDITCTNGDQTIGFGWSVREFKACIHVSLGNPLGGSPSGNDGRIGSVPFKRSFDECVHGLRSLADDMYRSSVGDDGVCTHKFTTPFANVVDEGLSEELSDDDLGRIIVSSDTIPEWIYLLGVGVAAGGVIIFAPEFLPALCLLNQGDHWSCPSSPLYPPGQTPQPDQGSP